MILEILKAKKGLINDNLFYRILASRKEYEEYEIEKNGAPPLQCPYSTGKNIESWEITGNAFQEHVPSPYNFSEINSVGTYDHKTGKYKINFISKVPGASIDTRTEILTSYPIMPNESLNQSQRTIRWRKRIVSSNEENSIWKIFSDGTIAIRLHTNNSDLVKHNSYIYCSHIPNVNFVDIKNNGFKGNAVSSHNFDDLDFFYVVVEGMKSYQELMNYFKSQEEEGHPVTIWYEMAEPITEPIEHHSLLTVKGNMFIDVESDIKPSNIHLTYKSTRKE